jgi:hypothetical protein
MEARITMWNLSKPGRTEWNQAIACQKETGTEVESKALLKTPQTTLEMGQVKKR